VPCTGAYIHTADGGEVRPRFKRFSSRPGIWTFFLSAGISQLGSLSKISALLDEMRASDLSNMAGGLGGAVMSFKRGIHMLEV
jgi:hypothetical protein